MNHPFSPSGLDPKLCSTCKRGAVDHTDRATCEVCGVSGVEMILTSNNILMCIDCDIKDVRPRTEEEVTNRAIQVRHRFAEIDAQIKISTDLFNAKTVQIHELRKAIDSDPSIPASDKYFVLAKALDSRYEKLNDLVNNRRQEIFEAENEQRAIQTYYNELGKKLRAEEREKLRLKDATYVPKEPVKVVKPKTITTKKIDVNEIRTACVREGIPQLVPVVATVLTGRKCTVAEAIEIVKNTMGAKK